MLTKQKLRAPMAEFIGTFMLASAVLVVSNMFGAGTSAWYIALSAGAALALIVTKIGHVSGAHVNPAVTVSLWTIKKITTIDAVIYIACQLLGGAVALLFFNYATNDTLASAGVASFEWRVFWVEAAGAAVFGSGIAAAISQKLEGAYAAITIGASLSAGALLASLASAGFLNPAVAIGNNALSTTLVLAPIAGMVVGMNAYMFFFAPVIKKKK